MIVGVKASTGRGMIDVILLVGSPVAEEVNKQMGVNKIQISNAQDHKRAANRYGAPEKDLGVNPSKKC